MLKNYFSYFPIQQRRSDPHFEITGGGRNLHPPLRPYPNIGHPQSRMFNFESGRSIDSFQILWISHGKGIYRDRKHRSIPLEAGQSLLLFPNHWHAYCPDSKTGWEEHWLEFRGAIPEKWLHDGKIKKTTPILQTNHDDFFLTLFHELHRLNQTIDPRAQSLRNSLAFHLLQRVISFARVNPVAGAHSRNQAIISPQLQRYQEIQEKMAHQIPKESLLTWCSSQGISYHTFRLWFQKENGISPKQYLSQLRLRKAKEWLLASSLQIQEIAEKTGFANPFHFSNHFKKMTGLSPKKFRLR